METGTIFGTLGHRELGAIHPHQAQAKGKAARGLCVCKGAAEPVEEVTHHAHAQVATAIAQGGSRRRAFLHRAHQAQGAQQSITDRAQRAADRQTPDDEQVDQEEVIELAFALLPGLVLTEHAGHHLAGVELFEHRERKLLAKLVKGGHLRYAWHQGNSF